MENFILEKVDQWAIKDPNRPCFQVAGKHYTYADLKRDSDTLANRLNQVNSTRQPVLIYGGIYYEMVVSFIAAMKAGMPYIPVDNQTPIDRVEMIIEVAQPGIVLAWDDLIIQKEIDMLEADALITILSEPADKPEVPPISGDDVMYIIFTSGTTGVPKGVQITFNNLTDHLNWLMPTFSFKEGDNFLAQTAYSFDVSIMITYPCLINGGILHPVSKELISDFNLLFNELKTMNLDIWISTPSFVEICLLDPNFNGENYPSLRSFILAGEELKHSLAATLVERFPNAETINAYGPTEATIIVTKMVITPELLAKSERLPIGEIKSGTGMYIIDEQGNRLPDGEVGELIIDGPTISPGYLNNPEKTAEAFFDNEGVWSYHSGDAAYIKDGIVYYQGRIDFQIKLHGYRIELEDVEHNLNKVSFVKTSTVVPKYKEHKVQQLVAYVVANPHEFEKEYKLSKAIKEEMKTFVMDYMVPQKFIYVDALPLTQNGKVDRKKLIAEVNE